MTDLQTLAAKAVAEAQVDPNAPAGLLITATYLLRQATQDDYHPLAELRDAVKWAMEQQTLSAA